MSIVAVHGLNPYGDPNHHIKTWRAEPFEPDGPTWLENFLPQTFTDCRIMLYRYNSNIAFKTGAAGVSNHAESLLNSLLEKRREAKYRPLIFFCHSLGGLVVKQAFVTDKKIFEDIKDSTKGMAFFGTPHHGAKKKSLASLGLVVAHIVRKVQGAPGNALAKSLEADSNITDELALMFERQSKDLRFITVYESVKTSVGVVVEPESAILGFPRSREIQLDIERNHSDICKFRSEKEWAYERFSGFLKLMLDDISRNVEKDRRMRTLKRLDEEEGRYNPKTLNFATNTDMEFQNRGMFKDSIALNRDIIRRKEKALGSDHADTLFSRQKLAWALQSLGEYKEAEDILKDMMDAHGQDKRAKLLTQRVLGHVLQRLGKYTESLKITSEVETQSKIDLSEKDQDTLSSSHNLAWLHLLMHNYKKSEPLFRSVLKDRKATLGPENINTLDTQGALAYVLMLQKKYPESKKLRKEELEIRGRTLGAGHNSTLECMRNLAYLLNKMDEVNEAESYYEKALQGKRAQFGIDHPDTIDTEQNLRHVREGKKSRNHGGESDG
ncbi:hypothetical protein ASPWEDRAFT_39543 [Aspergillus wentii DTO 134E9]|uniref:DUF676 domain-containing protein n=1 Tax=Aspergillus wentii DTO 134E9 TaxID=1073089 RepID=A0A1L9RS61_ASPWE|nr:uncharacterized protein ASPWEDRAFT_39543 [Aspergillus wentii DTO 134E9]OJJ37806.1 hypothetical protein ASPWEDRAFT_39543 [Aspergillus wentii DTO 134E9]